ncbi:hypothetical protein D9M68_452960 [compost metagenome]
MSFQARSWVWKEMKKPLAAPSMVFMLEMLPTGRDLKSLSGKQVDRERMPQPLDLNRPSRASERPPRLQPLTQLSAVPFGMPARPPRTGSTSPPEFTSVASACSLVLPVMPASPSRKRSQPEALSMMGWAVPVICTGMFPVRLWISPDSTPLASPKPMRTPTTLLPE